jgi:protein involved in polysaccharide export with SLBB domain
MSRLSLFGLALVAGLLVCPAMAADEPPAAAGAPPGVQVAPTYRLGPGDVLDVVVPTHDGFNSSLTVQPDGRVYYSFVGEIMVAGLTVPELTERIQQGLEKELRTPKVSVSVRQVRPGTNSRVTVTGAVRAPNAVDLREKWRVSDAVAAVGGPVEKADLKRVTYWHDGKAETLDLSPILVDGKLENNPVLAPGDVLVVPERARLTVSVTGEGVRSQSSFEIDDPDPRVLKALQRAGGHTPNADLKRAWMMRAGGKPEPLDLDALIIRGDMSINHRLGNGDTIHVPALDDKVFVFGEVLKPDAVPLKPDGKVLDVVSVAAPTRDANLNAAVLVRKQADGQPKATKLNLGRLQKGDLAVNLPLQNGDVILIPSKKKKFTVQDMLQYLYPIDILRRMFQTGFF